MAVGRRPADRDRQVEDAADGGPDGLGVVEVDRAAGQDDRVGTGRVGSSGSRCRRCRGRVRRRRSRPASGVPSSDVLDRAGRGSGTDRRRRPGVTLSLSDASARSRPASTVGRLPARSAYCSVAASVANTSTTQPGTSRAPSTAFGPSARKSRRSERSERRLSFRVSLTRALPAVRGTTVTARGSGRDLGRVDVLGQRGLGGLDEHVERGDVVDGQVGEDLAVDLDAGQAAGPG